MAFEDWDKDTQRAALTLLELINDRTVTEIVVSNLDEFTYRQDGTRRQVTGVRFSNVEQARDVVNELFADAKDEEENQYLSGTLGKGERPERVEEDTTLFETFVVLPDLDDPEAEPVRFRLHSLWLDGGRPYITIAKKTLQQTAA